MWADSIKYSVKKVNGEEKFTVKNVEDFKFLKRCIRGEGLTVTQAKKAFYDKKKIEGFIKYFESDKDNIYKILEDVGVENRDEHIDIIKTVLFNLRVDLDQYIINKHRK